MKATIPVRVFSSGDPDSQKFACLLDERLKPLGSVKHTTSYRCAVSSKPPIKEFSQMAVGVFIVSPETLDSRTFRSCLISSAWFATKNPDQLCVIVRQGLDFDMLSRSVVEDEVFSEAVRRVGVDFSVDEPERVADRIIGFLKNIHEARCLRRRRRLLWGLAIAFVATGRLLNHLGVMAIIVGCLLALVNMRWPRIDVWAFELLAIPIAFLCGMLLADIPARPNTETHRKNVHLWNWKLSQYFARIPLFVFVFAFGIIEVGIRTCLLIFLPIGAAFEIASSCLRIRVFLPLMESRGLSQVYESIEMHDIYREIDRISALAINRPFVIPPLPFLRSDSSVWDHLAARGGGSCCRTFFSPRIRVFISYSWHSPEDQRIARELKTWLDDQGIESFLDREGIPAASPWRAIIAREVALSSHFIFIASEESVGASAESGKGGTCLMEVRHALTLMRFSSRPALAFVTMQRVEKLVECAQNQGFVFLLENGYQVPKEALVNGLHLHVWLRDTRPNGWLGDLRGMGSSPEG